MYPSAVFLFSFFHGFGIASDHSFVLLSIFQEGIGVAACWFGFAMHRSFLGPVLAT